MTKEQKILLLLVLLVGGVGATVYVNTSKTPTTNNVVTTTAQTETPVATMPTPVVVTLTASSGPVAVPANIVRSFTSDITYVVPEESSEGIHINLLIKEGVIEDVRFTYNPPSKRQSQEYLSSFSKALQTAGLKGKKVSEVNLSRVGGASLTTAAFMKAVAEIDAKSKA